ncbi:hypothetical protein CGCF413_v006302 [Colletotrichum fructicola]|nr:hypothetical protein CGCF413_v006302 [Colletotrichum fructicola]
MAGIGVVVSFWIEAFLTTAFLLGFCVENFYPHLLRTPTGRGRAVCYGGMVDPAEPGLGSCSGKAGDLGRALARDTSIRSLLEGEKA